MLLRQQIRCLKRVFLTEPIVAVDGCGFYTLASELYRDAGGAGSSSARKGYLDQLSSLDRGRATPRFFSI
jgi:hypothetical protein